MFSRRNSTLGLVVFLWAALAAFPLPAQQERWEELSKEAVSLYHQGKYAEAQAVAEEALRVAEATFGPEDPNVATSLNNLAFLYQGQGKYAEAEPLYKRSLAIMEKALGPEHPDVATSLENYAALLRKTDRATEAEQMEARAKAIRARHALQNPQR